MCGAGKLELGTVGHKSHKACNHRYPNQYSNSMIAVSCADSYGYRTLGYMGTRSSSNTIIIWRFALLEIQSAFIFVRSEIQAAVLFHRAVVMLQLLELMSALLSFTAFATLAAPPIKDPNAPN
ncbi:hypothetical protein G5I_14474 [Acromyrmex echinatior]|uniref:Uncharacterized protein n=1 Tax=Acromyrmex echinatior TaxID=103372 RepID=F4X7U0_ACREC|nr:hypothetical protein G5I_14474 [Acromyrmex echinatior]